MVIYVIIMYVLAEQIRWDYPGLLQSWYADDFSMAGARSHLKPAIFRAESLGSACGFYLRPEKSQFVQYPGVSEEDAKEVTAPLEINHREGER